MWLPHESHPLWCWSLGAALIWWIRCICRQGSRRYMPAEGYWTRTLCTLYKVTSTLQCAVGIIMQHYKIYQNSGHWQNSSWDSGLCLFMLLDWWAIWRSRKGIDAKSFRIWCVEAVISKPGIARVKLPARCQQLYLESTPSEWKINLKTFYFFPAGSVRRFLRFEPIGPVLKGLPGTRDFVSDTAICSEVVRGLCNVGAVRLEMRNKMRWHLTIPVNTKDVRAQRAEQIATKKVISFLINENLYGLLQREIN